MNNQKKGAIPKRTISKTVIPKLSLSGSFARSGKTARTPPKGPEPANQVNESVYMCQVCLIADDIEKVRCDECLLWYHFTCAHVSKDIVNQDFWICNNCVSQAQQNVETDPNQQLNVSKLPPNLDQVFDNNPNNQSDVASKLPPNKDQVFEEQQSAKSTTSKTRKSKSVTSSVSRKAALALQRLEEERRLVEQRESEAQARQRERDKEYLRQKYSILEDDVVSNLSFDDEELNQLKFDSTRRWAENIPTNNDLISFKVPPQSSTNVDHQSIEKNVVETNGQNQIVLNDESTISNNNQVITTDISNRSYPTNEVIAAGPFKSTVKILPHPWEHVLTSEPNVTLSGLGQPVYSNQQSTTDVRASHENPSDCRPASLQLVVSHQQGSSNWRYIPPRTESQGNEETIRINNPAQWVKDVFDLPTSCQPEDAVNTTHQSQYIERSRYYSNNVSGYLSVASSNGQPTVSSQQTYDTTIMSNYQPCRSSRPVVYSETQPFVASQPQPFVASQPQSFVASQPQSFVASQPQSFVASQPRSFAASQPQSFVARQPQPFVASQPQSFVASQTQPFGFSQSVGQSYRQTQPFGFSQSVGQPHRQTQSFGFSQLTGQQLQQQQSGGFGQPNHSQSSAQNQRFSQTRSTTISSSVGNWQPYVSISSIAGQSLQSHNNYIPVSQPLNLNNSVAGFNGMNQNRNNGSIMAIPGRLTAEQIASRHVMPKDLPYFNGDPTTWLAFISAYENSSEECGFSNSENLGRLQKCLKGDAYDLVKTRLVHKDSVPGVIETLRMMFGRPELIIERMTQDIQKMPAPKEDDLTSLIKFAIAIKNLSTTIQDLRADEHLRNPMLINSVTDKLPTQHRLNWAFYKSTIGAAHIGHLGDWLYQIADVASQVVRVVSKSSTKKPDQKDNNKNKTEPSKSNPFINTQVEKKETTEAKNALNSNQRKSCPACHSNRCTKLDNCKKFKEATRTERWAIVKDGKLCGRCFGPHKYFRCQSNKKCTVDGCQASHHTLLHNHDASPDKSSSNNHQSSNSKPSNTAESDSKTCNCQRSSQRTDKFRIVPIMLHNKDKSVRDYAYLDDGSNMTTIEESLADELGLAGSSKELCVDWAFGQTHSTMDSKIVSMKISGYYDNAPRFKMTNVRTVKQLHLPTQSITSNWIEQYPHFKNVPIATYENVKPRLLIGLQYSKLIVSQETIEGNENEPMVCRTRLGWVVQGPTYELDNTTKKQFSLNMCVCQSNDNELHQLVKRYFAMENIGTKIPENILESNEIQRAKEILQSTTIKKGDRYETGLLWKHDDVELPANYNMALKRLICLEAKMAKDPELKTNLFNQIQRFTEKGYIRKLSKDEIANCRQRVWYLPTFPVFNPKKPAKVRLVWDGAAKIGQSSLNSNLLAGPDQLVPLPVLLRRFREREIGILGDIEEMFHQVKVREEDQHVQRFLWRDDVNKEPDVYVMMVMTFGSKCSPSSAQFVKNKNAEEFRDKFPRAVEAIVENHYVDDLIDCAESVNEAEKLVKEVKLIHKAGGFNIRNFASNSKELMTRIGEKTSSPNKNLNVSDEFGTERVLGMFWDTVKDVFTYSLKFTGVNAKMLSGEYHTTKREVLKILMSVFDPLGLIANFLVHGKILLQEIWRNKIEWDEKLPDTLYKKWLRWIQELPNVENLHIPRWYTPKLSSSTSIQLHTFVDASVEAFAAVSYLRIVDKDGIQCCLVGAKTKVAPTKPMSVPRLELQAAVLGIRLAKDIETSQRFVIQQQVFWSDSQTVLAWINSETRRYTQFVAFRVGEILESTEQKQWNWVPTKENVADEATKSKTIPKLDSNSRWFKASKFLYNDEETWSNGNVDFTTEEELRPSFVMSMREIRSEQLIDLDRFSQWKRLVRTQAYVLRFVYNAKTNKQNRRTGSLSQDELIQAENALYQRAQRDVFLDEILILKYNENCPEEERKEFQRSSELRRESPYLDENNVLRTRGRLDNAKVLPLVTKRPIILPRHHRVTKLLVDSYHRKYKHMNHQTALNEIRQKYNIPAVRVVLKSIRNSCQKCKNSSTVPMIPEMAGLPLARLAAFSRPFTYTGVDYFGPFYVRQNRSTVKRYGVIFTCLTTRALHLEVADSLNTSSCIKAIRRFAARKGEPREFFSDNGSNFHGTENELKEEFEKLNRELIQQEFTSTEQKWTFNPPTASHMGGAWERLIQTVKSCLKQMLTTKTPTQEMLVTLMAEVENIINSRPLTYVSLESSDDEALTPNHFLFGSSNALKPIGATTPHNLLRNDWKAIQQMTNHFWNRFVLEYMPDLTKRTKWFSQVKPIQVGDVVLVIDNRNPRNTWPKGLVEEVFPDKHGRIRHVIVKIGKRTLPRPVSKLAILDVRDRNSDEVVNLPHTESVNEGESVANHPVDGGADQNGSSIVLPDKCVNWTSGN